MKRLALAAMVMVGGWGVAALAAAGSEKTCAQTISETAKYPEQLKATRTAVTEPSRASGTVRPGRCASTG